MSNGKKSIRRALLNPVLLILGISIFVFLFGALIVYLLLWWLGADEKTLKVVSYSSLVSSFVLICLLILYACIFKFRGALLHYAIFSGREKLAKWLIARGTDINAKTKTGWTPLHEAAGGGHTAMVDFLVSNGAVIDIKDKNGQSPLHLAAFIGDKNMIKYLITKKGTEINLKNNNGKTPMSIAAEQNHLEVVELLQKHGGHE